ncbi:unnamed protein product [Closterium sp. NIES-53]
MLSRAISRSRSRLLEACQSAVAVATGNAAARPTTGFTAAWLDSNAPAHSRGSATDSLPAATAPTGVANFKRGPCIVASA